MVADIVVTFVEKDNSLSCVAVCNAIIVQLSRIMSILLTGNVWSVSTRVMCGDDYAIISWREVIVKRSAVRRQEINTKDMKFFMIIEEVKMATLSVVLSYVNTMKKYPTERLHNFQPDNYDTLLYMQRNISMVV